MNFKDRIDAGQQLGSALHRYKEDNCIVLGLTRGGLPVAYEVAKALNCPLDAICVRKLGVPNYPELGMGAIAPGAEILNEKVIKELSIPESTIDDIRKKEKSELNRQMTLYTGKDSLPNLNDKTVFIIDDGVATGGSLEAAIKAVKKAGASQIIAGVPVGPPDTITRLVPLVDHFLCLYAPMTFMSVGTHYIVFQQVTDDEVIQILKSAKSELS